MILAGDVGGTKTILALFELKAGALHKVREASFTSRAFSSLEAILEFFLAESHQAPPRIACFGVPGAVIEGRCRTTNLPWILEETLLSSALRDTPVRLLNDLEAAAVGMLHLRSDELVPIQTGSFHRGNIAVIAAGTGLGEGFLIWNGKRHQPIASEGGHCDFAPANDVEDRLLLFLRKKLSGHVSWERVLSGPGIVNLYEFLREDGHAREQPRIAEAIRLAEDPSAVIGAEGVAGTDPLCSATLNMFASLYGAEAGNMALKTLATGGVYIGGGIAPKILPVLQRGAFSRAFTDKGRFTELMQRIPVHVAMNPQAPLLGAAHFAASHEAPSSI